ncbi:zinc finger and BTB domain-containing protein 38 isoform X2 [Electrophorus electricus]|uniref:zinc finger and BTB domain-containing protein 38 isoform X2 n=1 Tax=Electrophorus electricus TaxID=8005 RepID=UPI0015D07A0E|nr:zinc finger and BTB domain-containing protein 38 isoform X2 [Electrophorus electricus]
MNKLQMMVVQSSTHGMTENSYPSTILTRLSEQRLQGLFCDVTIVVEDIKFRAHRNILAATSGYFHNAFTASDTFMSGQVLELPDLKSEVFASILNFMYSSRVESANTENNKNLVAAGKRLGIPFLEKLLETPQESEVFQRLACTHSESSSSQLKLSGTCALKKETQRLEEQDCSKGPRITNAFSITEVAAISNPFTPMNLSNNGPQSPDTSNHPSVCTAPGMPSTESDPNYAMTEPTHALSEHSYAVSQGHQSTDLKEGVQLCDKGNIRPVVIPSKTLTINRIGPLKKRHIHRKGTTSISDETKVSIQNPGRSPVVQNIVPDPSSIVQSPAALSGSSPNLLAPVEVTPPQDADPPSLIPENISSASVYHCQQCTEAFSNLALLTIHMQIHNRRFVSHLFCKYCHKNFMHLKRLHNHEQVCMKGPPELELNGKKDSVSLDSNNTFRKDDTVFPIPDRQEPPVMDPTLTCPLETPLDGIAKSNSQRAYKCSMCKRAYVTLSSLKRHENVHSWQRAYPCHYCNKVFALAEYRTKHEIWHTGERRYQCIFCLETFMTYYILKNHQKSFHGIDPRLAVNKKSANGGLKGSVYPIKLYRLLPMKFRKKRYKSYSQTYSEGMSNHEQSFSDVLDTNSPAASLEGTDPTVADSAISGQSLFSMPVTFMATPKMVASEMPRITFDQPCDQNKELALTADRIVTCPQQGGLHATNNAIKNRLQNFEGTGSPVFSYGYQSSVTTQENAESSMVMHKNNSSHTQNSSTTNRDVLPFLNIPPVCSFEGLSKLSELSAAAQTIEAMANQLFQPRPEKLPQSLSPAGKTETYIAKPACPGPSMNSEVLPLCQITVKIGNEAIIRRKIKGSKLFPKKKKRRSWKKVEDQSSPLQNSIGCPSLRLRAEVTTSVTENEPYDDVNDPENDKLWRPYYKYKPKRKGKKLRSKQKRMKSVQFYTKPLSPEPDGDDFIQFGRSSEESIPEESSECRRQLRSHGPKEAFPCHSCSSSFSTPTSLSMHIVSCHQPHCKICGKQCPLEECPSADLAFTDKNGDFMCQRCTENGSCFSSDVAACSLSTEKRYRCSYCPQRFLYLATKKSHEAKHLEKLNTGRSCRYSPKVCKSAALLSMHDNKHFSNTIGVRQLKNTENKVTAEPYSPVKDSKGQNQPAPWGSAEICSPRTSKTEEPVETEMEGIFHKTTHMFKKTSLSFCCEGNRPFSPILPEIQRKKAKKKNILEHCKDFSVERHRQDSVGAETERQKGPLPNSETNYPLNNSRPYPTYLRRVPVTTGASLQSPKSEWHLCKEESLFYTHN